MAKLTVEGAEFIRPISGGSTAPAGEGTLTYKPPAGDPAAPLPPSSPAPGTDTPAGLILQPTIPQLSPNPAPAPSSPAWSTGPTDDCGCGGKKAAAQTAVNLAAAATGSPAVPLMRHGRLSIIQDQPAGSGLGWLVLGVLLLLLVGTDRRPGR